MDKRIYEFFFILLILLSTIKMISLSRSKSTTLKQQNVLGYIPPFEGLLFGFIGIYIAIKGSIFSFDISLSGYEFMLIILVIVTYVVISVLKIAIEHRRKL